MNQKDRTGWNVLEEELRERKRGWGKDRRQQELEGGT